MSVLGPHLPIVPSDITAALETDYAELAGRFARGDWGAASLNGGRMAESLFRYLEWRSSGEYTPIGTQIRNRDATLNRIEQDTSLEDGVRFQLRRIADLLFDVRNKRDVAHLGTDVDVREMDSRLVLRLASWAVGEVVRVHSQLPTHEIQALLDRLAATHSPLVEEIDGELVVLATELDAPKRALAGLYSQYPEEVELGSLRAACKYGNVTRFRKYLERLAKDALVHQTANGYVLTRKGVAWVEENLDLAQRGTS